jgi:NADPH-dependent curcumin reductase CurA
VVNEGNFEFLEDDVPDIKDGEFLIKNLYLSFDPAQRGWMEGFIVLDYMDKFPEAIGEFMQWESEGKIIYQEDIQEGIENAAETLLRLYTGENKGKQFLKIAEPE